MFGQRYVTNDVLKGPDRHFYRAGVVLIPNIFRIVSSVLFSNVFSTVSYKCK